MKECSLEAKAQKVLNKLIGRGTSESLKEIEYILEHQEVIPKFEESKVQQGYASFLTRDDYDGISAQQEMTGIKPNFSGSEIKEKMKEYCREGRFENILRLVEISDNKIPGPLINRINKRGMERKAFDFLTRFREKSKSNPDLEMVYRELELYLNEGNIEDALKLESALGFETPEVILRNAAEHYIENAMFGKLKELNEAKEYKIPAGVIDRGLINFAGKKRFDYYAELEKTIKEIQPSYKPSKEANSVYLRKRFGA